MKMLTVLDTKGGYYKTPFFTKTTGDALRAFETIAKDPNHEIGKFPSDFTLMELGSWDDLKAKMSILENPIILANASEYANKQ